MVSVNQKTLPLSQCRMQAVSLKPHLLQIGFSAVQSSSKQTTAIKSLVSVDWSLDRFRGCTPTIFVSKTYWEYWSFSSDRIFTKKSDNLWFFYKIKLCFGFNPLTDASIDCGCSRTVPIGLSPYDKSSPGGGKHSTCSSNRDCSFSSDGKASPLNIAWTKSVNSLEVVFKMILPRWRSES